MKLYMFPIAPNPTKVRLYLAEKRAAGCPIDLEEVTVNLIESEQNGEAHLERSPFGTVPVLELDDGTPIFESLAIIEYLEERFPTPSLYGPTPEARAVARMLERTVDLGVLGSIARIVHATRSPIGRPPNPAVVAYFEPQLEVKLQFLEKAFADGRPFVAGDAPTVADCSLAAGIQFGRFRDLEFLDGYAAIQAWDERYRAREATQGILLERN